MSPRRNRTVPAKRLLVAAILAAVALPVVAEPAPEPEADPALRDRRKATRSLEVVEVEADTFRPFSSDQTSTGMKFDAPLRDVPQSVTIVPQAVIETQAATSLSEALRNVAGLTLASGEGGFTGDNVTLRGFAARTDQYVNGVRDNAQYIRDTFNIESVEVLKGASSMLFGRGGTGGVINSITKRPTGDALRVLTLMGGTDSYGRFTADVDTPIGENAGLRINALYQDNESFRDVVTLERKGIAPSFAADVSESTSVHADLYYIDHDGILDYGIPFNLATGRPLDVPIDSFYGAGSQSVQQYEVFEGRVGIETEFANGAVLRNNTAFGAYDRFYRTVRPNTVDVDAVTPDLVITRNHNLTGGDQDNLYNLTDLAFDTSLGGMKHDLAVGLELGREDFTQKTRNLSLPDAQPLPPAPVFDPQSVDLGDLIDSLGVGPYSTNNVVDTETTAAYLQDTISLNDQWKGIVGIRHDRFDADVRDRNTNAVRTADDSHTSYRLGTIFQPDESQSYYASWSTSFNPSAETFTLTAANQSLDPEENENFEIGAKLTPWGERIALNMAVFRLQKTNARTVDPANTGVQILDGEQRSDGFEIELQGAITRDWRIFAGAAWMDPEITKSNDVNAGVPIEGNRPANAPTFTANLWSVYELGGGWQVGAGAFHVGERYANTGNTLSIPTYTRYDAYLGWENGPMRVALNVYNLTDKRYFDFAHPVFATPGADRNARVSFTYAF